MDLAIKRNSEALQSIVMALFAMLGDVTVSRLPKPLYRAVLLVLAPPNPPCAASSSLRRGGLL
jgi:hypothetical protein